jgi:hypothetical protein
MQLIAALLLGVVGVLGCVTRAAFADGFDGFGVELNRRAAAQSNAATIPMSAEDWQFRTRRLQSCAAMYICTAGDVLTGPTTCTSTQSTLTGYICTSGDALDATTHICTHRTPKVIGSYVCTGSDTLSGTTCYSATVSVTATCPYTLWNGGCYTTYAGLTTCSSGWAVASAGQCSKDLCAGAISSCNSRCYSGSYADSPVWS